MPLPLEIIDWGWVVLCGFWWCDDAGAVWDNSCLGWRALGSACCWYSRWRDVWCVLSSQWAGL